MLNTVAVLHVKLYYVTTFHMHLTLVFYQVFIHILYFSFTNLENC